MRPPGHNSGVAQIGYVLMAVAAGSKLGAGMALFFFAAYLFSNMGAFFAAAFTVFLLSLGGIPFALGFWGKMYVFLAAGEAGLWWLIFLGALLAVVALYYYLNVVRWMLIVPEKGEELRFLEVASVSVRSLFL